MNPLLVLAIVLPLLTIGVLFAVQTHDEPPSSAAPVQTPLQAATVLCPAAGAGTTFVGLADATAAGPLGGSKPADLTAGAVSEVAGPVITGADATAPGLAAVRVDGKRALTCGAPAFEQWFVGLGAGAEHRSEIVLTNPDAGTAVADVILHDGAGPVDMPELRGVSVAGRSSVTLDLAREIPTDEDLAAQVRVSRGRLGVVVPDSYDPVGSAAAQQDWVPAQVAPQTEVRLVGLGTGTGARTLTMVNPGETQTRVKVQVITQEAEFMPAGLEEIVLGPGRVESLDLSTVLSAAELKDAVGVHLSSDQPVAGGVRTTLAADLVRAVPVTSLEKAAGIPLPTGEKRLVLAGATTAGSVTPVVRDAAGKALQVSAVEVSPARATSLTLPDKARWLTLDPGPTGVGGAVLLGSTQGAGLALPPLVTEALAPRVRQAQY